MSNLLIERKRQLAAAGGVTAASTASSTILSSSTGQQGQSNNNSIIVQYSQVQDWILHSIHSFRESLLPVLFLLFAHSYLKLARDSNAQSEFFEKFSSLHKAKHQMELLELEQGSEPFKKRFLATKIKLKISKVAEHLFLEFLADKLELLGIVTRYVEFEKLVSSSIVVEQTSSVLEAEVFGLVA